MATKTYLLFISITLLILSGSGYAEIYKWVDEDGNTHFSSSPPAQGKADIVQPKINTYTSHKPPTADNTATVQKPTADKKVVMYSAVWCGVCKKAKSYFKANRIPFTEYDIDTSSKGKRDYKQLHGSGVPIILVGAERMDGFSAKRFQNMYGR